MAKFKSRYSELTFYVNGKRHKFAGGVFNTDDKDAIAVLDKMADAHRVDVEAKTESKPKAKPEAEKPAEPAPKQTKGKPSAKK